LDFLGLHHECAQAQEIADLGSDTNYEPKFKRVGPTGSTRRKFNLLHPKKPAQELRDSPTFKLVQLFPTINVGLFPTDITVFDMSIMSIGLKTAKSNDNLLPHYFYRGTIMAVSQAVLPRLCVKSIGAAA
jgi:hypothetical protein